MHWRDPRAIIAAPGTSTREFREAVRELGPITEPPEFWQSIADDRTRDPLQRAMSVVALFRRHVHPGMSLERVAAVVGHPDWMDEAQVSVVTALGGEIPVTWSPNDSVLVLQPFARPSAEASDAVYLRIQGHVTATEFVRVLRGSDIPITTRHAPVLDLGFSEVGDDPRNQT